MVGQKKSKLRAVWLGQALREIRDLAGLNSKDAGAYLGKDGSTVIRMENGDVPVSEPMLEAFMEMCGVTDPHKRAELMTIRKDVAQKGWWDGYKGDVAATLMDRAWMESKAVSIRAFEPACLPGLLQTPEYAETLMRARSPETSDAEIERWVDMRMARQYVLTRHRPVAFSVIITQHLLTMDIDRETMRLQLSHLADMADRPNVELHVLPERVCTGVEGPFEVFELAEPYPEIAYVTTPAGEICLEEDPVVRLHHTYDRLLDACLPHVASKALIIAERDNL
ncbi:transcriptional regulator [Actinorhabdospora filicis]|uniref:Transcriptional regulator n=1 Tax=Actinorhabdospora filicis TaxID=1785913 RepID=A0A9W6SK08_9ACTN|nr:helix-turn-helix transcriptional regulator [Actinorhabdospora filicis]GLZ77367.1 transcriptional regulator [Actinorhabdospora filicis]